METLQIKAADLEGMQITTTYNIEALWIQAQPVVIELASLANSMVSIRHEGRLYQMQVIGHTDDRLVAVLVPKPE